MRTLTVGGVSGVRVMRWVRLGSMISTVALASSGDKRIATIIVPMDKAAEQMTLRIEGYANDAVREFDGLRLKTSDDLFGVAPDEDAQAALKRADQSFLEGKAAFEARDFEGAEKKLRATIREYEHAVGAMKRCGDLCEAVAMYASALQTRGDVEEAKLALLDLLALAPGVELDRQRYAPSFVALRAQVATSRNAQLLGNINVRTKPLGARVYLNGDFRCFSPCTLPTLPIGKQLVRIDRPGFRRLGRLVEVTPEDQEVDVALIATPGYQAFDALLDKVAGEALKNKGGSAMGSLASSLKLDRALIGVLREVDAKTELVLGYFDLKEGRRFSTKRATFQGDEFGELKGEIGRMVNTLLDDESGEKASRSGDPLAGRHGMEDWNAEDKGGRAREREKKQKKKGGDPLDSVTGTEDW